MNTKYDTQVSVLKRRVPIIGSNKTVTLGSWGPALCVNIISECRCPQSQHSYAQPHRCLWSLRCCIQFCRNIFANFRHLALLEITTNWKPKLFGIPLTPCIFSDHWQCKTEFFQQGLLLRIPYDPYGAYASLSIKFEKSYITKQFLV